ncbi:hypothetical protein V22_33720 [Calycomorphotria hydatis]|uniref:Uncharacterized protein n=1 Tax=Calycomorphotria hydatis TaxID=2528027 RepID=A0A517TCL5_9PLAN|nr:hypothetical protein V22_33720 [Calycomorphotria hydatis]
MVPRRLARCMSNAHHQFGRNSLIKFEAAGKEESRCSPDLLENISIGPEIQLTILFRRNGLWAGRETPPTTVSRHPRVGGGPRFISQYRLWIPVFAGMTNENSACRCNFLQNAKGRTGGETVSRPLPPLNEIIAKHPMPESGRRSGRPLLQCRWRV